MSGGGILVRILPERIEYNIPIFLYYCPGDTELL